MQKEESSFEILLQATIRWYRILAATLSLCVAAGQTHRCCECGARRGHLERDLPVCWKDPSRSEKKPSRWRRKGGGSNEMLRRGEENPMVTWVLTEEPTAAVRRALELIEERVASDADVMWLCPSEAAEPIQE
jgi:hypothetical protein